MAYTELLRREYNDGTAKKSATYEYDSIDEAKGSAKRDMGNAMLSANTASIGVIVIDNDGFATVHQDYWKRPVVED